MLMAEILSSEINTDGTLLK